MGIVVVLLKILEVLVCLLLVGVILLQRTKGSGGGVSFGGGMGEAIFGAQMGNVLTKTTVILGIVFLVNTIVLSILAPRQGGARSLMQSEPAPAAAAPATTEMPGLPEAPAAEAPAATPSEAPAASAAPAPAEAPAAAPAPTAP